MSACPVASPTDSDPHATRSSRLQRLKDWGDQQGWQEFFDTYRKLIYAVALYASAHPGANALQIRQDIFTAE